MESKAQKFERVAKPRIEAAKKAINLLNNLSAPRFYTSTKARRAEIVADIRKQLDGLASAWGLNAQPLPEPSANFPVPPLIPKMPPRPKPADDDSAPRAVVDGRDRQDIRYALRLIQEGHIEAGTKHLQSVVLGWPVYSPAEEEARAEKYEAAE